MDPQIKSIARAAAKALQGSSEEKLTLQVEEALLQQDTGQLADPVSIGSLLVSISSLAWTICWAVHLERKKDRQKEQDKEKLFQEISARLREELQDTPSMDPARRERMVAVIAEATVSELAP